MSHTPTPWNLHWPDEFFEKTPQDAVAMFEFGPGDWGSFWVVAHNGVNRDSEPPYKRADPEADMKFIQRAVNSHDALVAAVKAAKKHLNQREFDAYDRLECIAQLDAALALAEPKETDK